MIGRTTNFGMREVLNQCQYADIAYKNIQSARVSTVVTFYSIHSFLTHMGMLSKLLWSEELKDNYGKDLAQKLNLKDTLKIKEREFRNILEHYDERLKKWLDSKGKTAMILDNNIGPRKRIISARDKILWVRHYEPATKIFTLIDKDLDLSELYQEVTEIKNRAVLWLNPKLNWDDLDDEEKQMLDEDRLLDELSEDYVDDPLTTMERLDDLSYGMDDLNI